MPIQRKMNRSDTEDYILFHIYEMSKIVKSTETKSRLAAASGWNELWAVGVIAEKYRISSGGKENILKLIMLMVAQLCKCTKNQLIVYFK